MTLKRALVPLCSSFPWNSAQTQSGTILIPFLGVAGGRRREVVSGWKEGGLGVGWRARIQPLY